MVLAGWEEPLKIIQDQLHIQKGLCQQDDKIAFYVMSFDILLSTTCSLFIPLFTELGGHVLSGYQMEINKTQYLLSRSIEFGSGEGAEMEEMIQNNLIGSVKAVSKQFGVTRDDRSG